MRRKGTEPMSEVEIVAPTPKTKPKSNRNRKKR
jgi:hypothetical protein